LGPSKQLREVVSFLFLNYYTLPPTKLEYIFGALFLNTKPIRTAKRTNNKGEIKYEIRYPIEFFPKTATITFRTIFKVGSWNK
jgi:hypothetical protein